MANEKQKRTGILLRLLEICFAVQLLVGVALWSGHAFAMRNFHMAIGIAFVMLLWAIAVVAFRRHHRRGLAIAAILWGLVIPVVGIAQLQFLPGDMHWIVRVVHLAVGLAAMPMASLLATARSDDGERPRVPA